MVPPTGLRKPAARPTSQGRQRLRQLIEEGKLYEQEHGLTPKRARKRPRLNERQVLTRLLDALTRIARPSYRPLLAQLAQALAEEVAPSAAGASTEEAARQAG